jgi:hypothetical protein
VLPRRWPEPPVGTEDADDYRNRGKTLCSEGDGEKKHLANSVQSQISFDLRK